MSLITNPLAVRARRVARSLGIPRLLSLFRTGYEETFSTELIKALKEGDVAWDVGANVGYYSVKLADLVGPAGRVFAFEPSPKNIRELRSACNGLSTVAIRSYGLSDKACHADFLEGADNLGATSRVLDTRRAIAGSTRVELRTGDEVIRIGEADVPNVIKIDVEGHELYVLEGLRNTLTDRRLRSVFVEIHFAILEQTSGGSHPRLIERLLEQTGFRVVWIDPSHLHAFKV